MNKLKKMALYRTPMWMYETGAGCRMHIVIWTSGITYSLLSTINTVMQRTQGLTLKIIRQQKRVTHIHRRGNKKKNTSVDMAVVATTDRLSPAHTSWQQ